MCSFSVCLVKGNEVIAYNSPLFDGNADDSPTLTQVDASVDKDAAELLDLLGETPTAAKKKRKN